MRDAHRCDPSCVCPIHDTPLLHSKHYDQHACKDQDCEYTHGTTPMRDDNVIQLTVQDCRIWIRDELDHLGCTFDQLADMHRTGHYDTLRHRIAWVCIGGWYGTYEPAEGNE